MQRTFETVHPDATIEEVSPLLGRHDPLPVCDHGRLIGLLRRTDLDGAPGSRDGARGRRIRDLITPELVYCLESTDLEEARALMRELSVAALPVLDARRALIGVLHASDLPADGTGAGSAERAATPAPAQS